MRVTTGWCVSILAGGAALAYAASRRHALVPLLHNMQRYSAPSAPLYDALATPLLARFFRGVAHDLAALAPHGRVLEIGSGPGRLAVMLAAQAPEVQITGIDLTPAMVERANTLAARSGVADRVTFQVGDVAALPVPDASVAVVVSTFSLHHWADPGRGLAEIYRVLRPGGVARIYDVVDWLRRVEQRGPGITELAAQSPFGGCTRRIVARLGPFPLPLVYWADLRRAPPDATNAGAS